MQPVDAIRSHWTLPGGYPTVCDMLFDNETPRYLPHLSHPEVLQMGLTPLGDSGWIETDNHLGRYHRHKLHTRGLLGERAYRCTPGSLPAQRELSMQLLKYLTGAQAQHYRLTGGICTAVWVISRLP